MPILLSCEGEQDEGTGAVWVCGIALCVCLCQFVWLAVYICGIHVCLSVRAHAQPCCLSDTRAWICGSLASMSMLDLAVYLLTQYSHPLASEKINYDQDTYSLFFSPSLVGCVLKFFSLDKIKICSAATH